MSIASRDTDYAEIHVALDDGVATITLNRPERLNAWTPTMGAEVQAAIESAVDDTDARAIVITGAGRGFCAGADMGVLQAIQSGGGGSPAPESRQAPSPMPAYGIDLAGHFSGRFGYLLQCPKPIIAAINGPIAGLGLVFALFADLRFAARGARFTTAFAQRGLVAEHGIAWLLPRLVGHANALDLLMSSRRFDADEAARIGLVNQVFEPDRLVVEAGDYARALARTVSPRSMAVIKSQVYAATMQDFDTSLALADAQMLESFETEDFREGVAHFIEKRAARFPSL
ncbi:MAG: enoyl-CoA hydratase [Burkholderiaceae bacterium]